MIKYFCVTFSVSFLLLIVPNVVEVKAQNCTCGTSEYDKMGKLIIEGKPVDDMKKYPFIVSIHQKSDKMPWGFCGGALISDSFVLTAAHCLIKKVDVSAKCLDKVDHKCFKAPNSIEVGLLGEDKKKPAKKVSVHSLIIYPGYSKVKHYNDIALIKLEKPVECSAYTRPICITEKDFVKTGDKVTVAGFGRIEPNEQAGGSEVLREGSVKRTDSKYCNPDRYERLFCTVGVTESSCEGDSGTAAFTVHKGRYFAVGVTSRHSDYPACTPVSPVTFAKVSSYMKFITKHVKNLEKP